MDNPYKDILLNEKKYSIDIGLDYNPFMINVPSLTTTLPSIHSNYLVTLKDNLSKYIETKIENFIENKCLNQKYICPRETLVKIFRMIIINPVDNITFLNKTGLNNENYIGPLLESISLEMSRIKNSFNSVISESCEGINENINRLEIKINDLEKNYNDNCSMEEIKINDIKNILENDIQELKNKNVENKKNILEYLETVENEMRNMKIELETVKNVVVQNNNEIQNFKKLMIKIVDDEKYSDIELQQLLYVINEYENKK